MTEYTPRAVALDDLYASLEALHHRLVDLEAMANAAANTIEQLPYLPQRANVDGKPEPVIEQRRPLGRMQSLVLSTADAARVALDEIEAILGRIRCPAESDSDDEGSNGGT